MSTSTIPSPAETGFARFIDKVKAFFVASEPVIKTVEQIAVDAEPILAFTPFGPEYALAVNAVMAAQGIAEASLNAGTKLTNEQKFQIALHAALPALNVILSSKGITTGTETVIANWVQIVFNILAGPISTAVEAAEGAPAAPAAA